MKGRLAAGLLGVAAIAVLVIAFGGSDDRYLVKVELDNAGGLRKGANVRVAGAPSGRVTALDLDDRDRAIAELRLDPQVAPVGAGARAVVDTDGFFGERFVEIDRGDLGRPQDSGTQIPAKRASVSTRLDDVVDALDLDTRDALRAFLNEQGAAVVGRGGDLADTLAALPQSLDSTGELLAQLGADNRALGRLIESSDRVVGEIAGERRDLGRLVTGFAETLDALDSRRSDLGETFRRAPATLRSARATLASLEAAAGPLIPAARGLRSSAPALTRTLAELPRFAKASVPALRTIERVSPALRRLGRLATPTVRRLRPLAGELSGYTEHGLEPFSGLLDKAGADVLGTMEGWARSTQGRDASSQIFRFGATTSSDTLGLLLPRPAAKRRATRRAAKREGPRRAVPTAPKPQRPSRPPPQLQRELDRKLEELPAPVRQLVEDLTQKSGRETINPHLLDFLLKP